MLPGREIVGTNHFRPFFYNASAEPQKEEMKHQQPPPLPLPPQVMKALIPLSLLLLAAVALNHVSHDFFFHP